MSLVDDLIRIAPGAAAVAAGTSIYALWRKLARERQVTKGVVGRLTQTEAQLSETYRRLEEREIEERGRREADKQRAAALRAQNAQIDRTLAGELATYPATEAAAIEEAERSIERAKSEDEKT